MSSLVLIYIPIEFCYQGEKGRALYIYMLCRFWAVHSEKMWVVIVDLEIFLSAFEVFRYLFCFLVILPNCLLDASEKFILPNYLLDASEKHFALVLPLTWIKVSCLYVASSFIYIFLLPNEYNLPRCTLVLGMDCPADVRNISKPYHYFAVPYLNWLA